MTTNGTTVPAFTRYMLSWPGDAIGEEAAISMSWWPKCAMGSCFTITRPGPGDDVLKEEQSWPSCCLLERVVTILFAEVLYRRGKIRSAIDQYKRVCWGQFRTFCNCLNWHVTMKFPLQALWTQCFLYVVCICLYVAGFTFSFPGFLFYVCMYIVHVLVLFKNEARWGRWAFRLQFSDSNHLKRKLRFPVAMSIIECGHGRA